MFYEVNDLPFDDEFLNHFEPPCFNCDIDRGNGTGGSINYLTLLYRALAIAAQRHKEQEEIQREKERREYEERGEDLGLSEHAESAADPNEDMEPASD